MTQDQATLFAPLTYDELDILYGALGAGWRKQAVIYRCTSDGPRGSNYRDDGQTGLWEETLELLHDVTAAEQAPAIGATRACPDCGRPQHYTGTEHGWAHDALIDMWHCADPHKGMSDYRRGVEDGADPRVF